MFGSTSGAALRVLDPEELHSIDSSGLGRLQEGFVLPRLLHFVLDVPWSRLGCLRHPSRQSWLDEACSIDLSLPYSYRSTSTFYWSQYQQFSFGILLTASCHHLHFSRHSLLLYPWWWLPPPPEASSPLSLLSWIVTKWSPILTCCLTLEILESPQLI